MSREAEDDPRSAQYDMPDDVELLGYNRDVGFFRSESMGLVFVVQAGVVLMALPAIPREPAGTHE